MAVVGQNTTLLQEIPLFSSQEPVNNILLHQVLAQFFTHMLHISICSVLQLSGSVMSPFVCRVWLWWAAPCLWLGSRLKAVLCTPTVKSVPEPEGWAVIGAQRRPPAGPPLQSEYCWNIKLEIFQM